MDELTEFDIAKQLFEMSLDMDYMDYAEYAEQTINEMTECLKNIKGTTLYNVLDYIVYNNYEEELPLLSNMLKIEQIKS